MKTSLVQNKIIQLFVLQKENKLNNETRKAALEYSGERQHLFRE